MLLAIDIGNTRTNCGIFNGDRLTARWDMPTGTKFKLKRRDISAVALGSVVPEAAKIIKKSIGIPVLEVNSGLDLGLKIRYRNPKQVGADRLANAVAAKSLYGMPAFVVDFGTATTIDVISRRGDYLGGIILPGLEMVRRGLKNNTALLPLAPLKRPKRVLGQTTAEAIQSGLYYGFYGMVKQLILDLKKELRFPEKTVIIATGGGANFFKKGMGVIINPLLTLQGLRLIYEKAKASN